MQKNIQVDPKLHEHLFDNSSINIYKKETSYYIINLKFTFEYLVYYLGMCMTNVMQYILKSI